VLVLRVQDGDALSWESWCEDESVAEKNEGLLIKADSISEVLNSHYDSLSVVPVLLGCLVVVSDILLVLCNGILKSGEVALNLRDSVVLDTIGSGLEISGIFVCHLKRTREGLDGNVLVTHGVDVVNEVSISGPGFIEVELASHIDNIVVAHKSGLSHPGGVEFSGVSNKC